MNKKKKELGSRSPSPVAGFKGKKCGKDFSKKSIAKVLDKKYGRSASVTVLHRLQDIKDKLESELVLTVADAKLLTDEQARSMGLPLGLRNS